MLILLLLASFIAPLSAAVAGGQNGQSGQYGTTNNDTGTLGAITTVANNSGATQGGQTDSGNTATATPTSNSGAGGSDNSNANSFGPSETGSSGSEKQYSKPDVTPKGETEQIRAREQTMLQYRNMTMQLNCTRNCTVIITSDEEVTPQEFGLTVDPNQTMTLAMNLTKSPLNGAVVNERCLNFYLGIEPNATLQLQAQIRLRINQTELNQNLNREVNASRLTWMYWNQTQAQWQAVESYMDQNGYLVCNTNHFSTWTVAEATAEEATPNQTNTIDTPTIYLIAATIAIVAVIGVGIIALKRRK